MNCTKIDFDKNFSYKDKYIQKVSKKDIWFLINVGEKIDTSKNKNKNILIFQKSKDKSFNIYYLFKEFLFFINKNYKSLSFGVYKIFPK